MINTETINNIKYDIILPNELGRKYTVRYKQYSYSDVAGDDGIMSWELQNFGCGPTSIATILSSIGIPLDPVEVAKLMLLNELGEPLDFFTNRYKNRLGISTIGFIYLLQTLIYQEKYPLEYQLVKYSYMNPNSRKDQITEMIENEYMALILVGPNGKKEHPRTFSNYGHYIAVTSVNKLNKEFYVANPNRTGDSQFDLTFSYETLIENMYSNTFDFLMIKNKSLVLRK